MTIPPSQNSPTSAPTFGQLDIWGLVLALGGSLFFSAKSIFIKLAYIEGATAELVLALRMAIAVPIYIGVLIFLLVQKPERKNRLTWRSVVGASLVGALGYYVASYLDFSGLEFISAQYARLVLLTYPFFTVILGLLFFGDRMKPGLFSSLAIAWIGLSFIFGWNLSVNADGLIIGTALVLAAAIAFALYQHLAKREMNMIGTLMFTCIGSTSAGLAAILHFHIVEGLDTFTSLSPRIWMIGIGLGVLSTVLPTFMLNGAISRVGARVTSAIGTFGPIMTIILAIMILGETFTIWHFIGSTLVLYGAARFARAENAQTATQNR